MTSSIATSVCSTSSSIGSRNCPSRFRNSLIARLSARSLTSYVLFIVVAPCWGFCLPEPIGPGPPEPPLFFPPIRNLQLRLGQLRVGGPIPQVPHQPRADSPRLHGCVLELERGRVPLRRPPYGIGLGGDECRRYRDSGPDLAREGRHRPEAAPAHSRGHVVGRGDGSQARQPLRPDRPGSRSTGEGRAAYAGVELRAGCEAGLRVPGADGDALRRGPGGRMDGDRPGGRSVDHRGPAHEGESRAPGPPPSSCARDSR